jgi:poly(3-hydroxybutyrate) depolymerase
MAHSGTRAADSHHLKNFDAAEIIWQFFKSHRHSGPNPSK